MTFRTKNNLLRLLILALILTLVLSSAAYAAPRRSAVTHEDAPATSALAPGQTCGDPYEPNENFSEAASIQVGINEQAYICTANDEDWFKFNVTAGQEIEVNMTNLPADYDLVLYDPGATAVEDSTNADLSPENVTHTAQASGEYRIRIKSYNGAFDSNNPYTIRVQIVTPTCGDPYEWNDTFATAHSITPPDIVTPFICTEDDEDWFQINVTAGQSIDLWVSSLPADYDLYLYKPDGSQVDSSRESGTADERIIHTATASGWYRALISGYNGAYDADDYYSMQVTLTDPPTPTPSPTPTCPDTYEPNDVPAQAIGVASGIALDAYICSASDIDWFKIGVNTGQTITVDLTSLPADYDIYLYAAGDATHYVASSASGGTANEQIVYVATQNGDYGVKVVGDGGAYSRTDPYTLEITLTSPTLTITPTPTSSPTPTITPTATPDNCGDVYEPNNDALHAQTFPIGADVNGFVCQSSDEDWFQFTAAANKVITVDLINLANPDDFTLTLFKPNGDPVNVFPTPITNGWRIVHTSTKAGDYRIQIRETIILANAAPRPNSILTGSYTMRTTLGNAATATPTHTPTQQPTSTPRPTATATARPTATPHTTATPPPTVTPVVCHDAYEPNETLSAAKAIPANTAIQAYICSETDDDWFKFNVASDQIITIDLTSLPADYDLYLYDPSGQQIGKSEKSGQLSEQILHTTTMRGSYKVWVTGYGSSHDASNPYTLHVQLRNIPKIYTPMILRTWK